MKIVCISDTHGAHNQISIPDGDLIIHAGDISRRGKESEIIAFNDWLSTLPHRYKVVVAGNHDFLFERDAKNAEALLTNAVYLRNNSTDIEGIKIWGSPVTPWFFDWAFNRQRGADIRRYWEMIPHNIDILVTHGPPRSILDKTERGDEVGCDDLLEIVWKVKPRIHLFGHIHESYGQIQIDDIHFINASIMNLQYKPVNDPIVVEL